MAVAMLPGIATMYAQPTHAAAPATVTIPSMKLPWDKSITTIPLRGGSFGHVPDTACNLEHRSIMSGVDFGLPQNTNVLAVAAGKVIYAGYTYNQIRNEVRIDHDCFSTIANLPLVAPMLEIGLERNLRRLF